LFKTPVQNLCIQQNNVTGELYCDKVTAVLRSRALRVELQAAFGRCLPGYVFKCKLSARGTNRWLCSYMAVPAANTTLLTPQAERVLRSQLNLNNDQIAAIRRLLIKGY
jgi:hypothetical protein